MQRVYLNLGLEIPVYSVIMINCHMNQIITNQTTAAQSDKCVLAFINMHTADAAYTGFEDLACGRHGVGFAVVHSVAHTQMAADLR